MVGVWNVLTPFPFLPCSYAQSEVIASRVLLQPHRAQPWPGLLPPALRTEVLNKPASTLQTFRVHIDVESLIAQRKKGSGRRSLVRLGEPEEHLTLQVHIQNLYMVLCSASRAESDHQRKQ